MNLRWKTYLRGILSDQALRRLLSFVSLRFPNGSLNLPVASSVIAKNILAALWNFPSVWKSNLAIKLYRQNLRQLASRNAFQDVKLLHLIYGLKQSEPIHYFQWALIERMINTIKPDQVLFHYTYEPQGVYWEKLKTKVHVVKVPPFEFYGIAHLRHYAHKADVVRLLALYEMGGLYLDIDTLVFKSFDDLFSVGRLILGVQRLPGSVEPFGLGNAVILAPQNNGGIHAWLRSYMYFRGKAKKHWDEHSVRLPLKLLRRREDVKVLDTHAFFEIDWDEADLFFDCDKAALVKARVAGAYSQHLCETFCMSNLLADFKVEGPANKSFLAGMILEN